MFENHAKGKTYFLIDGFPRNFENAEGWAEIVGDSADVLFILFLNVSEEVMEQRLLKRGETSGRVDDKVDVIKKRFNTYMSKTMPVLCQECCYL